jgi:hypothetical protein
MLCEEGMTIIEARSVMLVPHNIKETILTKTQSNTRKINKHCTNYGMTNRNLETCRKKEQTIVATTKVTQPSQKTQKTCSYAFHIYGLNGHKMTDCPKFAEMQNMFHGKSMIVVEVQPIVETQIVIANVNVVDVNATTKSKVTKEHVFQDKEPRKAKSVVNLEKE